VGIVRDVKETGICEVKTLRPGVPRGRGSHVSVRLLKLNEFNGWSKGTIRVTVAGIKGRDVNQNQN